MFAARLTGEVERRNVNATGGVKRRKHIPTPEQSSPTDPFKSGSHAVLTVLDRDGCQA